MFVGFIILKQKFNFNNDKWLLEQYQYMKKHVEALAIKEQEYLETLTDPDKILEMQRSIEYHKEFSLHLDTYIDRYHNRLYN